MLYNFWKALDTDIRFARFLIGVASMLSVLGMGLALLARMSGTS